MNEGHLRAFVPELFEAPEPLERAEARRGDDLRSARDVQEQALIRRVLEECGGNQTGGSAAPAGGPLDAVEEAQHARLSGGSGVLAPAYGWRGEDRWRRRIRTTRGPRTRWRVFRHRSTLTPRVPGAHARGVPGEGGGRRRRAAAHVSRGSASGVPTRERPAAGRRAQGRPRRGAVAELDRAARGALRRAADRRRARGHQRAAEPGRGVGDPSPQRRSRAARRSRARRGPRPRRDR